MAGQPHRPRYPTGPLLCRLRRPAAVPRGGRRAILCSASAGKERRAQAL